jgi:hypothetical protein
MSQTARLISQANTGIAATDPHTDTCSCAVRARGPGEILPQRHDREQADDSYHDDDGLDHAAGDVAEGDPLVLPPDDRLRDQGAGRPGTTARTRPRSRPLSRGLEHFAPGRAVKIPSGFRDGQVTEA